MRLSPSLASQPRARGAPDVEREERRLHEVRARSQAMKRHVLLAAGLGLLLARTARRRSRPWNLAGRNILLPHTTGR